MVVIVNKIDLIEEEVDRQQILDFIRENGRHLLGADPQIFTVSARLAMQAKQAAGRGEAEAHRVLWRASHFDKLEQFTQVTLNDNERLRLKLENPLGVASRLIDRYIAVITERQEILRGDFETIDTIDDQFAAYEKDMRRDFSYQRSRVENVLYEMLERGDKFFDEVLRLTRVMELVNSEKLRGDFTREVVADSSREIERHVNELIDWMIDKDYRQWRAIMDYLRRRAEKHTERMVGQINNDFELNRQNLLGGIGRNAQRLVDSYDREAEALKMAQAVQSAVFQTAAVEVGALGLGAVLVIILQGVWLDVTGILGASAVAALGLYLLPYKRSQVKAELRKQVAELRDQLEAALTRQFDNELQESAQRLQEAIAPYMRFVRAEREKLEKLDAELRLLKVKLTNQRNTVQVL